MELQATEQCFWYSNCNRGWLNHSSGIVGGNWQRT